MKREVTLQPFAFNADFAPASTAAEAPKAPIQISMEELMALIHETRRATAELVRDETLKAETQRLSKITGHMHEALSLIVALAAHLEKASLDEHDRRNALENVRKLAQTLLDGQGDLFPRQA